MEPKHTLGNDLKTNFKDKSKNIFNNEAPGLVVQSLSG